MRFHRQEDIAILVMSELAQAGGAIVPLSVISRHHGVSAVFLKKIVRDLRLAGLVRSKEGVSGGYALAKPAQRITVWEILCAVDAKAQKEYGNRGTLPAVCPLYTNCLPQQVKRKVSDVLEKSLRSVTLAQLVE